MVSQSIQVSRRKGGLSLRSTSRPKALRLSLLFVGYQMQCFILFSAAGPKLYTPFTTALRAVRSWMRVSQRRVFIASPSVKSGIFHAYITRYAFIYTCTSLACVCVCFGRGGGGSPLSSFVPRTLVPISFQYTLYFL